MDECTIWLVLILLIPFIILGISIYGGISSKNSSIEKNNAVIREYVCSVVPTDGKAENNSELMSQMRPADEVMKYVDLKCKVKGNTINGFIAVTKERLIFKTIAIGDNTLQLDNGLSNAKRPEVSFRFDLKEETANIPIKKVTAMSTSVQKINLDATGCSENVGNKKGATLSAHVLSINAQGIVYKLFLGECGDIADEFSRTFTSMTFVDE